MNFRKSVIVLFVLLAGAACAPAAPPAETFRIWNLDSQRLTGEQILTVPGSSGYEGVTILVTVGQDGRVIGAEIADNLYEANAKPALEAARQWTFRPQTFEGQPVQAVGLIGIKYTRPEILPDVSIPFPEGDPEDIEITLERTACFGTCPDYSVSIRGDGRVRFSTTDNPTFRVGPGKSAEDFGQNYVLWPGMHEAHVDPEDASALIGRFRDQHFMGLQDGFQSSVTDHPTYVLTLRAGGSEKRVVDYVGRDVGMPRFVTALEDGVDNLAGTQIWVRGNAETIAQLKSEGFDFGSKRAAELVRTAIDLNRWSADNSNVNALLLAALEAGLDLRMPANADDPYDASIGAILTSYAASHGHSVLFDKLAEMGELARMSQQELNDAFATGMGCRPEIARALVAAGANPEYNGFRGNALHELRSDSGSCSETPAEERAEMASVLMELGVPLQARDDSGWTPLMGTNDPELARVLLEAGADPNVSDDEGTTPLLSVSDDRVAILLLRAGADPRAGDEPSTVRKHAREWHMPATLAWLDAHGIR